eukprot:1162085-Pelagomonas_calceolata.AAC.1
MLMGIWKVTGSTRLQSLAVKSIFVFNGTPSGNMLVGIHNRMGTEFASKLNGMLVVKSQLLELLKGMLSRSACCRCAVSRPSIFTVPNLYEEYVQLVHTRLMGLSYAGSCVGPVWGAVPAA